MKKELIQVDPWSYLKDFTSARIALGRTGGSLLTDDWLDFKLAHAKARDAVHYEFDSAGLVEELGGITEAVLLLESQVKNRADYLRRPDLGRCLDKASKELLQQHDRPADVVFIVSDGLSALAVHSHVKELLSILVPKIEQEKWSISPIVIVRFARVAIEDEIGALLTAKMAVILIGERPGLGSPDSLGAYLVHNPAVGNTDANRNCVSNIRPAGLTYEKAAETIFHLLIEAKQQQLSGVLLKDNRNLLGGASE